MAAWYGPNDLRLENRPIPSTILGHSVVKVTMAGICATDLELTQGKLPGVRVGVVPGHEITGVVTATDKSIDAIPVGERVIVDTLNPCNTCEPCLASQHLECKSPGELGFTADGGWAEYVRVSNPRLYRVPNYLTQKEAVLAEPFAMPLGALLDCGENLQDRDVLVVGSGIAAIAFASAAFALGARLVQACIRDLSRADLFRAIDPRVQVTTANGVEPGIADVSIDAVGTSESIQTAIYGAKTRGLIIGYGIASRAVDDFPLAEIVLRNLRVSGHTNPKNVWPKLIDLFERRTISTAGLVDHVISIDDVPDALASWSVNLRTVIDFSETS